MIRMSLYCLYVCIACFVLGGQCFSSISDYVLPDRGIDSSSFRAFTKDRVPIPMMRAFIARHFSERGLPDHQITRHQGDDLLRRLMLFRVMGHQLGERILTEVEKKKEEERVYTIATYLGCDCQFNYIDEDGIYRGFHADLIARSWKEGCVNQVVPHSACLTHRSGEIPHAGPALLGKQIDICFGWSKSPARALSVDFTEPFVRSDSETLFVVKSGNPNNFDPNDIRGKKIGFEDGFVTDKICLLHARDRIVGVDTMQPYQEVYKENFKFLLDDVRHDRIDAFLTFPERITPHLKDEFEFIGDDVGCVTEKSVYGIKRKDDNHSHGLMKP
ncbi:uncharacterized protein [Ptychodera flava]|uniref:uncharacterized protein n=1 Tax=Ptychodera flava TaxID=63121 RepID=UPI00396A214B